MLKPIDFNPPEIPNDSFEVVRRNKSRLVNLANPRNSKSPAFKMALNNLKKKLEDGNRSEYYLLQNAMDCRAIAYLIAYDDQWSANLELSESFIERISDVTGKLNRQTLLMFVSAFFEKYDRLTGGKGAVSRLGTFLQKQLDKIKTYSNHDSISVLAKYSKYILTTSGPEHIADWTQKNCKELDQTYAEFGIAYQSGRRFKELCTLLYYIEQINNISLGAHHSVLNEVIQPLVYNKVLSDDLRLGHRVLEILIDRTAKANMSMSEDWIKIVFSIAGDPRVPVTSYEYRKWWAILGPQKITLMRGWLSGFDLRLFLKVLEEYGKSQNDQSLIRMYPARKCFLEGLIEQGLVRNSRLFINRRAEAFLSKNYDKENLPHYAIVKDPSRSMIYLQIENFHLVEGSHNCTLRIFPSLPEKTKILDYNVLEYTPHQLGKELELYSTDTTGISTNHVGIARIRHDPNNFNWQNQAISYLRDNGFSLDIEKLFTKSEYAKYIRMKGY